MLKNVSEHLNNYSQYGDIENSNTQERLVCFHVSKPDITLLPYYKSNVMLIETSDNHTFFVKITAYQVYEHRRYSFIDTSWTISLIKMKVGHPKMWFPIEVIEIL